MSEAGPITLNEMISMFGEHMPMEAINLVFDAPPTKTIGQIRAELREIAQAKLKQNAAEIEVARAIMSAFVQKWFHPVNKGPIYFDSVNGEMAWLDEARAAIDAFGRLGAPAIVPQKSE